MSRHERNVKNDVTFNSETCMMIVRLRTWHSQTLIGLELEFSIVFCWISAHPPFLAFLAIWGGYPRKRPPLPFRPWSTCWHSSKRPPSVIVRTCTRTFFVSCAVRCQKRQVHTVLQVRLVQAETAVAFPYPITRQVIDPPCFNEIHDPRVRH